MPRSSQKEAARTRARVLEQAADSGSIDGLGGLSIGGLAGSLGLSKSGVIGHFGSKEKLQLATVDAASARFAAEVWEPAAAAPPGLERLRAVMAAWLDYLERDVFPGGCFLSAASLEFDDRPGPVRDAVAAALARWLHVLEGEIETAQRCGDLDPASSARQLAFQLNACVMAANWSRRLFTDGDGLELARASIEQLLRGARPSVSR